jgi:hypothetical protein
LTGSLLFCEGRSERVPELAAEPSCGSPAFANSCRPLTRTRQAIAWPPRSGKRVRQSRARTNEGVKQQADVEAIVHADYEQANELNVVCLFSALGLVLSAAAISLMPVDAMSWTAAHLHLGMMSGH